MSNTKVELKTEEDLRQYFESKLRNLSTNIVDGGFDTLSNSQIKGLVDQACIIATQKSPYGVDTRAYTLYEFCRSVIKEHGRLAYFA